MILESTDFSLGRGGSQSVFDERLSFERFLIVGLDSQNGCNGLARFGKGPFVDLIGHEKFEALKFSRLLGVVNRRSNDDGRSRASHGAGRSAGRHGAGAEHCQQLGAVCGPLLKIAHEPLDDVDVLRRHLEFFRQFIGPAGVQLVGHVADQQLIPHDA